MPADEGARAKCQRIRPEKGHPLVPGRIGEGTLHRNVSTSLVERLASGPENVGILVTRMHLSRVFNRGRVCACHVNVTRL